MKNKWRANLLKPNPFFLFGLLIVTCLFSCYQQKEGCLDIGATNFDFDADKDCCLDECCCSYPNLKLEVLHKLSPADSLINFELGKEYDWPDGNGELIIESVRLYLSNIKFRKASSGSELQIVDTINMQVFNSNGEIESKNVIDNFVLIDPRTFSYDIGEIRETGTYDILSLYQGVNEPANKVISSSLPTSHPLYVQEPPLKNSDIEGFFTSQVVLKRDTFESTIPDTINIFTDQSLELELATEETVKNGINESIILRINYLFWLEGIDFAIDNNLTISEKISSNLSKSFEVVN